MVNAHFYWPLSGHDLWLNWGWPRGFGEQGNKGIYFRRTMSKNKGNRGTKVILGNIENQDFDFEDQGN